MEEKVLDLLAQLHNEVKDMKNEINGVKNEINDMKANMATKDDIRRLEGELLRFENRTDSRLEALFDGYKQNTEAIYELRKDVNNLKSVVEQHEIKLKIVK